MPFTFVLVLTLAGPTLKVLAPIISIYCYQHSEAFRICKANAEENPSVCIAINRQLQDCSNRMFVSPPTRAPFPPLCWPHPHPHPLHDSFN